MEVVTESESASSEQVTYRSCLKQVLSVTKANPQLTTVNFSVYFMIARNIASDSRRGGRVVINECPAPEELVSRCTSVSK